MTVSSAVAIRIRLLLKEKNMTQYRLEKNAHIQHGSMQCIMNGRNKTVFYSCEKYPQCDFSSWDMPTNEKCPDCGEMLFRKKGQATYVCHGKNCGYKRAIETAADNQD